jgi:drug/metabolite transporter (DMT)-like permease
VTGVVLALLSALAYGAADFAGGIASRARSAVAVAAISAIVGIVVFTVSSFWFSGVVSPSAVGWGAASGVAGMLAACALYAALSIGPMSLVAPLTAVISGGTPVLWAAATGEHLEPVTISSLGALLLAAVLITAVRPASAERPLPGSGFTTRRRAVGLSVVAGLLFGCFYILLAQTPAESAFVPLIANRAAGAAMLGLLMLAILLHRRLSGRGSPLRSPAGGFRLAILTGVLDAAANALYVLAVRAEALAIVAVVASLYPAATVALSSLFLRERITPLQWSGVALALIGIGLLAL